MIALPYPGGPVITVYSEKVNSFLLANRIQKAEIGSKFLKPNRFLKHA
jgi:hypothetical protein